MLKEKTIEAVKAAKKEVSEDLKNDLNSTVPKIVIGSAALIFVGAVLGATFGKRVNLHIYIHN